jgi:GTP pyrophosphokinase
LVLTPDFTKAVEYACAHHATDVRKGTSIPYVAHLLAVCALVLEHGGDETAAVAALLHDVVEDGGGERALAEIGERFGDDVAALVKGCSDTTAAVKEDWGLRKERYLEHLEAAPTEVLLVSAADKLHNARSILADLRVHGDELWTRFNRGAKDQLWYYGSLRDAFCGRLPGPLADELDRTVRDVNRLVDPDDRIEWLGERLELWSMVDGSQSGGMVDWPGRPLTITKESEGLVVHADVGRRGNFYPEDDPNDLIEADIGDLWLDWDDDAEVAWLRGRDRGHLREMCDRVASLAPRVAQELADSEAALEVPTTTFDERIEHGPWSSTSASSPTPTDPA